MKTELKIIKFVVPIGAMHIAYRPSKMYRFKYMYAVQLLWECSRKI